MANLTIKELLDIITKLVGCEKCGRYDLYSESAHTEHTPGWQKLICPHCMHSISFPVRTIEELGASVAETEKRAKDAAAVKAAA